MKINNLLLVCFVVFFVACTTAKKSSEVTAAYIPSAQYASMSCEELYDAAEEIRYRTPALARAVDQSRKRDKTVEQVGMWLFWPAVFFLEGNAEEQTALALAKGQLDAIRTAGLKAKCGTNQAKMTETKEEKRIKELQEQIETLKKVSEKKEKDRITEKKVALKESSSKNVSVSIKKPRVLNSVSPEYSEDLRTRGREGTVIVLFNVDSRGKVFNVSIFESSGHPDLDLAVLEAIKETTFYPALKDGEPFTFLGMKRKYSFSLED